MSTYSTWLTAGTILAVSRSFSKLVKVMSMLLVRHRDKITLLLDRKVADSDCPGLPGRINLLHFSPRLVERRFVHGEQISLWGLRERSLGYLETTSTSTISSNIDLAYASPGLIEANASGKDRYTRNPIS